MGILTLDGFDLEKTDADLLRRYPGSTLPASTVFPDIAGRLGGKCLRAENGQQHTLKIAHTPVIPGGSEALLYSAGVGIRLSQATAPFSFNLLEVKSGLSTAGFISLDGDVSPTTYNLKLATSVGGPTLDISADLGHRLKYDVWYYIELELELGNASSPESRLLVDNEVVYKSSLPIAVKGFSDTTLRLLSTPSSEMDVDDLYIYQNCPSRVLGSSFRASGCFPTGDEASDWVPVGSQDNYEAVDDNAAPSIETDDDVSYVTSSLDADKDKYALSEADGIGGAVYGLEYSVDTVSTDETIATMLPVLELDAEENLPEIYPGLLSLGYQRLSTVEDLDPTTGLTINVNTLLNMKAGYKLSTETAGSGFLTTDILLSDAVSYGTVFLDGADDLTITAFKQSDRIISSDATGLPFTDTNGNPQHIDLIGDTTLPRASFEKGNPKAYDGFRFPQAGDPKFYQLTVYPDKDNATAGFEYFRIKVQLSYPAGPGGVTVAYTTTGSGTTNSYLSTPWSIVGGASPITIAEGDDSTTITIRVASDGTWNTWQEYWLYFNIDIGASSGIRVHSTTDQFRLYIKSKETSDQFPSLLHWLTTSFSEAPSTTVSVPGSISLGPGTTLPQQNEPYYWYWTQTAGTAVEGTDWDMVDKNGSVISQGHSMGPDSLFPAFGTYPRAFVKLYASATGKSLTIKGNYEEVTVKRNSSNENTLRTKTNENQFPNTQIWTHLRNTWTDEIWPDDPASGTYVANCTLPGSPNPLEITTDGTKTDSFGNALSVFAPTADYLDPAKNPDGVTCIPYIRKDLSGQFYTDGSLEYYPNLGYTLVMVKVTNPSPNTPTAGHTAAHYARLSLRDKGSNVRDPGGPPILHPAGDSNGAANFQRNLGDDTWSVHSYEATGSSEQPTLLAGVENHVGDGYSILWLLRDDTANPNRLQYGSLNALLRPVWCPSKDVTDVTYTVTSKALCMYDPFLRTYIPSDPVIAALKASSTLPAFWPVFGNHWEPRGNLVIADDADTDNPNSFTINVT